MTERAWPFPTGDGRDCRSAQAEQWRSRLWELIEDYARMRPYGGMARGPADRIKHHLTTLPALASPPAQPVSEEDERRAFEAWMRTSPGGDRWDVARQAWHARSRTPAAQARALTEDAATLRAERDAARAEAQALWEALQALVSLRDESLKMDDAVPYARESLTVRSYVAWDAAVAALSARATHREGE